MKPAQPSIDTREALSSIERYLASNSDAPQVTIESVEALSGGAIQENWGLSIRLHRESDAAGSGDAIEAVLRTDAGTAIDSSLSRTDEYALLELAFDAGVTVAEPLWCCDDTRVIGRPFFIMRRKPGTAAAHRITRDEQPGGDGERLAFRLGAELGQIHALPTAALSTARGEHAESPAHRLVGSSRRYLDSLERRFPALEWVLRWLEREAPAAGRRVLCHGDYRTGNYLVDDIGLTAILDWEFAGIGDPGEDIGWFCARCWRFGAPAREAGGIGTRETFYRGYESTAARTIDRDAIAYWEVAAHMKWAIIALKQAARHRPGDRGALLLALTGHIVPELQLEMLRLIRGRST